MRKVMAAAATGAMFAVAGCGNSAPSSHAGLEAPDGTIGPALHNAGFPPEWADNVHDSFQVIDPKTGRLFGTVYNLTDEVVGVQPVTWALQDFIRLGAAGTSITVTVNPGDGNQSFKVNPLPNPGEHAILVVPDGEMPRVIEGGIPAGTLFFNEIGQTVSVVQKSSLGDGALPVELCQAEIGVWPVASDTPNDPVKASILKRLAQEQVCNSEGDAVAQAAIGVSYEEYLRYVHSRQGRTVVFGGDTYVVNTYAVTSEQYAGMLNTATSQPA